VEIDHGNCYYYIWGCGTIAAFPYCPVALDVAALAGTVRAKIVRNLLAVLVSDLVLSTLEVGLEVELAVPIGIVGVGCVVVIGIQVDFVVLAD
jgi:hypothetical protein